MVGAYEPILGCFWGEAPSLMKKHASWSHSHQQGRRGSDDEKFWPSCGPTWVFPLISLGMQAWWLHCQKASEGTPWQGHWTSTGEVVCQQKRMLGAVVDTRLRMVWEMVREMVRINRTVPSPEGARWTRRGSNQQSLSFVTEVNYRRQHGRGGFRAGNPENQGVCLSQERIWEIFTLSVF